MLMNALANHTSNDSSGGDCSSGDLNYDSCMKRWKEDKEHPKYFWILTSIKNYHGWIESVWRSITDAETYFGSHSFSLTHEFTLHDAPKVLPQPLFGQFDFADISKGQHLGRDTYHWSPRSPQCHHSPFRSCCRCFDRCCCRRICWC